MRRNGLFWGAVLVLIGGLLLANNLGIAKINFAVIWPTILIALGAWVLIGPVVMRRAVETEQVSIPLEGATKAHVRLRHGAGRLEIKGGAGANDVASGAFGGGVEYRARMDGDTLKVRMRVPSDFFFPFPMFNTGGLDWSVALNNTIPMGLDIGGGANDAHLDLTELKLTELRIETGASSMELALPVNAGFTKVRIESGASSMNIRVPGGVAAHIRASGGASDISVDASRFPRVGDVYQSPDYETAANKVEIKAEIGAGAIRVR